MTKSSRSTSNGQDLRRSQTPAWRWVAVQFVGLIRQFGSSLIWAGVAIYLIREVGRTFRAYAGQVSIADLFVSLAGHFNLTVGLSGSVAGASITLYVKEYRRHRKTRERLTDRITQLELKMDPKRESSMLTTEGTTRVGDL